MESSSSGIKINDRSTYHDAQLLFEKMNAYYLKLTKTYHQDVKITQGGTSFDFLQYKDSEGQSHTEINFPLKGNLVNFFSTQDRTEFKVLLDAETENHENTDNTMFNSKSDLQHVQFLKKSCPTKAARTTNNENTKNTIGIKQSDLQSGNESCSSNIDDSSFQSSNIPPWLDYTLSDTENCNSNEDYSDENKTLYHRGFPVELVSHSTKKFHLNNSLSLLESVTFKKEDRSSQKKTLFLFRCKTVLYSPCALIHTNIKNSDITFTNATIDILCINETESEVGVEVLTGLSRYTAIQIAEQIQFLNNGRGVRKLKDLISCLILGNQKIDIPECLDRVTKENEENMTLCYSLNLDLYGKQSRTSTFQDIKNTIAENIKRLQQEMNKNQQDINFNMDATKDNIVGNNSSTNCITDSKWTDRTKMRNSKVRTQSDSPTWKICLQNREDETEGLVRVYFGNPLISRAVYEFFGQYVDYGYKGSFERPHIPWPSMHPLLPYKCRYLDNRGS